MAMQELGTVAKEINSSKLNIPDDMTISFSSKEVMAKPYKEQRYKRKKEKILILGNGISMMGKIIHLANFAYAREIC